MPKKLMLTLDTSRRRPVQARVSAGEKAAVAAYCEAHGCSISDVLRGAVNAGCSVAAEPVPVDAASYISARMDPEEIAQVALPAQCAGMEPTTWLRLAVLAYVGAGGGETLRRQLNAASKAGRRNR